MKHITCEHNKRKSRCKDCEDGGYAYCEHGKEKQNKKNG